MNKLLKSKKIIVGLLLAVTLIIIVSFINVWSQKQYSKSSNYPASLVRTFYSYNIAGIPDAGHEYTVKFEIHPNKDRMKESYIEITKDDQYSDDKTVYVRTTLE